jgi:chromosome condensin MukBEF MukE localization factor
LEYANSIDVIIDINKIFNPRVIGVIIRSVLSEVDIMRAYIILYIIYNKESCTLSNNVKDYCALYTILYYLLHQ